MDNSPCITTTVSFCFYPDTLWGFWTRPPARWRCMMPSCSTCSRCLPVGSGNEDSVKGHIVGVCWISSFLFPKRHLWFSLNGFPLIHLSETRSHVVQAALEFAGQLRMTLDFWSSCHQLLSGDLTGMCHHACLYGEGGVTSEGGVSRQTQLILSHNGTPSCQVFSFFYLKKYIYSIYFNESFIDPLLSKLRTVYDRQDPVSPAFTDVVSESNL